MRFSARVLFLFVFLALFSFFAARHIFAQTTTVVGQPTNQQGNSPLPQSSNQYLTPQTNSDVPQNLHTYTQSVTIEAISSMICQLGGFDPVSKDHKCLGVDPKSGKIGFVEGGGGAIGVMGHLIAATFIPPTSSIQYAHYLAGNFGVAKKAYAVDCGIARNAPQGLGFCSLDPLLGVWVSMRNIVYLFFVVIFIVIGVAIMLRVHIDPRTVMTIENQIPKIIIGILLVTFSLAIAGFLIDIMYVSIYLIGGVLGPILTDHNLVTNCTNCTLKTYADVANSSTPWEALGKWFGFLDLSGTVSHTLTGVVESGFGIKPGGFLDPVGIVLSIIFGLIILIAVLYTVIRIWITLLIAYISILLDIVFAPFWFIAGLLPGSSLGVGAWFRDMLANLAVFPAVIAMFTLAKIFEGIITTQGQASQLFTPPMVGTSQSGYAGLIAFGFLFMTPQVLTIMKGAFKAPKISFGPVFQPLRVGAGGPARLVQGGISYIADPKYQIGPGGTSEEIGKRRRVARAFGFGKF